MERFRIISVSDPTVESRDALNALKDYAASPDDSRDSILRSMLVSALLKVGEYADRCLIACTAKMCAKPDEKGLVHLYLGGGNVTSVKDSDGNIPEWKAISDDTLKIESPDIVIIEYSIAPQSADVARLTPTVMRYATALYDGENQETLNSILNEAL